ncbi:MAG: 1,6-anhydro-N-acetylmuramyl-L-alanine amidase AmpD [Methylococcaceae bacterium]|nr:1,6-anhydro-N-acetylmuramyl-L-alanine amidase AmpD [Methylococcaceae bacterium]
MDIEEGWLSGVDRVISPNCDERPDPEDISLVVIHGISLPPGEFGGGWIDRLFTNTLPTDAHPYFAQIQGLRVSAHALIHRDGRIVQYVPFHRRAWHAGASSFQGRERCNDYSIGIELEGTDSTPYEAAQYQALAGLIRALLVHYPKLGRQAIVGHSDIAPGRKTDPGDRFDWGQLRRLLPDC